MSWGRPPDPPVRRQSPVCISLKAENNSRASARYSYNPNVHVLGAMEKSNLMRMGPQLDVSIRRPRGGPGAAENSYVGALPPVAVHHKYSQTNLCNCEFLHGPRANGELRKTQRRGCHVECGAMTGGIIR